MDANPKRIKKDALSKIYGYVWTGPKKYRKMNNEHNIINYIEQKNGAGVGGGGQNKDVEVMQILWIMDC